LFQVFAHSFIIFLCTLVIVEGEKERGREGRREKGGKS